MTNLQKATQTIKQVGDRAEERNKAASAEEMAKALRILGRDK